MILEVLAPLLGGLGGYAARLAPEVLKFFDRKSERHHELAMEDKQAARLKVESEIDRQRAELNIRAIEAQGSAAATIGDIGVLADALKAQATPTGIAWVDALNASVRPVLTYYWCILFYTAAKTATFALMLQAKTPALAAIAALWGPGESAIASSMIAYWFADRSLRKGGGVGAVH